MVTKSMNFKVSEDLKKQFELVAQGIGISTAALLNILVKRTVDEQGIPFDVKLINKEADFELLHKKAMATLKANPKFKVYSFDTDENGTMLVAEDAPENIKEWVELG